MGQHHRPSCSAVVLMRVSRCRPSKRSDRMSTSYVLFLWFVICCQIAVRSRYSSKMLCHLVLLYQRYFFQKDFHLYAQWFIDSKWHSEKIFYSSFFTGLIGYVYCVCDVTDTEDRWHRYPSVCSYRRPVLHRVIYYSTIVSVLESLYLKTRFHFLDIVGYFEHFRWLL